MAFEGSRGTIEVGVDRATLYSEDPQTKEHGLVDGVSGATRAAFAARRGVPITVEGVRSGWDGSHFADP